MDFFTISVPILFFLLVKRVGNRNLSNPNQIKQKQIVRTRNYEPVSIITYSIYQYIVLNSETCLNNILIGTNLSICNSILSVWLIQIKLTKISYTLGLYLWFSLYRILFYPGFNLDRILLYPGFRQDKLYVH